MTLGDVRTFVNGELVVLDPSINTRVTEDNTESKAPSLDKLVKSQPFLVISIANCPQCEELGAFLAARGVPATVFVKWDKSSSEYPALKKALSAHAGEAFTFPQVFAEGAYRGGFEEVMDKADRGAFDNLFEREFDVEPCTLQRQVEKQAMVIYSLPNCPQCDVLYEDLGKRGVPVKDVFIKLDKDEPEYPSFKAQLQKLMGRQQFSFPQTFIRGVHQGNYDEVIVKADKGEFADFFSEEFGIVPLAAQEPQQPPAEAIAFDEDF